VFAKCLHLSFFFQSISDKENKFYDLKKLRNYFFIADAPGKKAKIFVLGKPYQPSPMLLRKTEAYLSGEPLRLSFLG